MEDLGHHEVSFVDSDLPKMSCLPCLEPRDEVSVTSSGYRI